MIYELGNFKSYKEVLDFVPRSVWEINGRTKEIKQMFLDDVTKHTCKRTKKGIAVSIKQNYSVFNPILGMNILKIWSNKNDNVIDPYAGRDRALITNFMQRNYHGLEICPKTFNQLKQKIKNWQYKNTQYFCEVFLEDGTKPFPDNYPILNESYYDFCYSCPPYWFKESYEEVPGEISHLKTEMEWRTAITKCASYLSRVLKDKAYAVFVLADIRHKGHLIPLHSHWIEEFINSGFKLKDIVINKTNPMTCAGINGYLRNRIMQKSHEYLLVFQKENYNKNHIYRP